MKAIEKFNLRTRPCLCGDPNCSVTLGTPNEHDLAEKLNELIDFENETRALLSKQYDNKESELGKQLHEKRNPTGHEGTVY